MPGENVDDFLIECLNTPELYKKLIAEFKDKQLPSETGLANILDRKYGVKGNAASIASKVFLKNLSVLGMVNGDNIFTINSYITYTEEKPDVEPIEINVINQRIPLTLPLLNSSVAKPSAGPLITKEIPVYLSGGREAKLSLPVDFSDDDLKKIVKVLSAYLP